MDYEICTAIVKVPLRNKCGEIVDFTYLDNSFYSTLPRSPCKNKYGFAQITMGRKVLLIHRMVMNVTDKNQVVYHVDGNKLNNIKNNLIVITRSQLLTKEHPSSKYMGVKRVTTPRGIKWVGYIKLGKRNKNKRLQKIFDQEIHAAYWRNTKLLELGIIDKQLNDVELLPDYVCKIRDLPVGISRTKNGSYYARVQSKGKSIYLGTFSSIEAAKLSYDLEKEKLKNLGL